jgi:hypothetical protein
MEGKKMKKKTASLGRRSSPHNENVPVDELLEGSFDEEDEKT